MAAGSSFARLLAAMIVAGALALPSVVAAQELQQVPGTSVSLVPQDGWALADGFAGFVHAETEASVLVAELPAAAHAQLMPLFSDLNLAKAAFASQGVDVEALATLATAGGVEVPLISGKQSAGGITFDKWIALFESARTVLVTVQAPEQAGVEASVVEGIIRSVELGDEPTVAEKLAALPFDVQPVEPFRVVDTIAGSGVLMTSGPLDVDPEGTQPILIVASQISQPVSREQQEQIAEALIGQTNELADAEIATRETVAFAGEEGILLGGTAQRGERLTRFVQYLAVNDEGNVIRLVAMAREDAFDSALPAIEATAATVNFGN